MALTDSGRNLTERLYCTVVLQPSPRESREDQSFPVARSRCLICNCDILLHNVGRPRKRNKGKKLARNTRRRETVVSTICRQRGKCKVLRPNYTEKPNDLFCLSSTPYCLHPIPRSHCCEKLFLPPFPPRTNTHQSIDMQLLKRRPSRHHQTNHMSCCVNHL